MYLTGSQALKIRMGHQYDFKRDWDLIASTEEVRKFGIEIEEGWEAHKTEIDGCLVEFINIDLINNRQLVEAEERKKDLTVSLFLSIPESAKDVNKITVISLEGLYVQKRSHLWRPNLNFQRHIRELEVIKRYEGFYGLSQEYQKLLKERIKLTRAKYKDMVPSLMQKNEDFFNDAVAKYYIHDDIHKVMAFYDEPLYEKLKFDESLAKCEKELWDLLPHEDKVKCVCEECFVIGVERFLIPKEENGEKYPPSTIAFNKALEKVCTNLTSGWFRDFAIDNWNEIKTLGECSDYYSKFFKAKESGELKHV